MTPGRGHPGGRPAADPVGSVAAAEPWRPEYDGNGGMIRPAVGSRVWLYPPTPWTLDGSGEPPPLTLYTILEWAGSWAMVTDGREYRQFRFSRNLGFLL